MTITTLVPDALSHIGSMIEIDSRLSWRAPDAAGREPIGGYLVVEADEAILIYTGVARQRDQMIDDVRAAAGGRRLSLFVDRNEADVVGNMSALAREFDVADIWYAGAGQIVRWFTHDAENQGVYRARPHLRYVFPAVPAPARDPEIFGGRPSTIRFATGRELALVYTILTTLGNSWTWDEHTRTLFTSDFLAHGATGAGGVVLTDGNDTTTYEQVRDHLFARFYWMREARVAPLLEQLDSIFDRLPVERIAPNHGCVLEGAALVARHVGWVRRAIETRGADVAAEPKGA